MPQNRSHSAFAATIRWCSAWQLRDEAYGSLIIIKESRTVAPFYVYQGKHINLALALINSLALEQFPRSDHWEVQQLNLGQQQEATM